MKAILILFAGNLSGEALQPLFNGENSVSLTLRQAQKFPLVEKTTLLAPLGDFSFLQGIQIEQRDIWSKKSLLEKTAQLQAGYDLAYFVFADSPFLDPILAGAMADRHIRYAAEYSYADGWPSGLAPEILSAGTAAILAKILEDDDGPVQRDMLFSVIQKDINAFDIETEISPVDLRCRRLSFYAETKRSLLLLKNFILAAGNSLPAAKDIERIVLEQPQILRTLPAFFPVQVYGGCPQKCTLCPYPASTDVLGRKDFMSIDQFELLLDKIKDFSDDAVIDLSLWGELSLHPQKMSLIEAVIKRNTLSLIVETCGIGWKIEELENCASLCNSICNSICQKTDLSRRKNTPAPLSWIVSLDTADQQRYIELHGRGFAEAETCAKKLLTLFPKDCYVQAIRTVGEEEDAEKFYRYWKEASPNGEKNIIIQKYDDFCGGLEKKQASDISPVIRQPCWHIMRDMPVLIDGTVPLCRENLPAIRGKNGRILGNVFTSPLDSIWKNGEQYYNEHCKKNYMELCANCDEYYTYNF